MPRARSQTKFVIVEAVTQQIPASDGSLNEISAFEAMGGHPAFQKLVDIFYEGVAHDPLMREMYPEEELEPAKRRLLMFLEQYWGGPKTYSEERGHPRLRMRHVPYKINPEARDAWLKHMRNGVKQMGLSPMHEGQLWDYLERAAHSLLNTFED